MGRRKGAVLAFVLAAAAFLGARWLEEPVRRERPQFTYGVREADRVLPPSFQLLSTLLGSFRSLLVDFLWIRAESLQRGGRYFAAAELARWITALQSRVESGWSFQAWNLGVNVPSVLPEEDRWPYVRSAIELLWKEGLRANPGSLALHYEIAWLWEYKVGGDLDPAGPRYRAEVRRMVRDTLGPPPWDVAAFAQAHELLPLLRTAVEPAAEAGDLDTDPLRVALDRALRAEAWERTFGLEFTVVRDAVGRYGDFDLGSPQSFVVLWAGRGLGMLEPGTVRLDALSLWRMRFRALRTLFRRGWFHLADRIDADYRELIDVVAVDPAHGGQAALFEEDRVAFLRAAVPILYVNGWRRTAAVLFRRLRGLAPEVTGDLSSEDFSYRALLTDLAPGTAARDEVLIVLRGLLRQSMRAWSRGYEEAGREYFVFARDMHHEVRRRFGADEVPAFAKLVARVRNEER
jgi:hypothetical protein